MAKPGPAADAGGGAPPACGVCESDEDDGVLVATTPRLKKSAGGWGSAAQQIHMLAL